MAILWLRITALLVRCYILIWYFMLYYVYGRTLLVVLLWLFLVTVLLREDVLSCSGPAAQNPKSRGIYDRSMHAAYALDVFTEQSVFLQFLV